MSEIKKHAYLIGTERSLIPEFIQTYFEEAKFMQEKFGEETVIIVVDESNNKISKQNAKYLKENSNSDVKWIHCDKLMQKKLFENMKADISDKSLVDLLDYEGYSYGRIMNKQFLMSSIVGADYLHRRDSDVKIMEDVFGYPSHIENKYLGKSVGSFKDIKGAQNFSDEQIIYLVGSGYSGGSSWKADFGIFMQQDSELISKVAKLFNYGDDLLNEYMQEIVNGNVSVEENELFLPKHNHPKPICGNLSFYKIFKYMPCSTILSTIGSDNLIRGYLKQMDMPIIYHTNFVYHEFGKERDNNDINYLLSYWPRMINKLAYYKLIDKLIFKYQESKSAKIENISDIDFNDFMNTNLFTYNYIENVVHDCIDEFIQIMKLGRNRLFTPMIHKFENKEYKHGLVDNMYYGFLGGNKLVKNWRKIIHICEQKKYQDILV